MLIRFYNFEEASLFVAAKRADGYFAEVVHQNAGHFYGYMAVDGFAVIVSEEAAPEGVIVPAPAVGSISEGAKVVAMLGLTGGLGAVLATLLGIAVLAKEYEDAEPSGVQIELLLFYAFLFVCWYGMLKLTRIYNRPGHSLYGLSRFVIKCILWLMILSYFPELVFFIAGILLLVPYAIIWSLAVSF